MKTTDHLLVLPGDIIEAAAASGMSAGQSGAAGATSVSGKRRLEQRSAFDKRLRFSVRQTESAYRYRDIVVKKQDGFTHILLSTKSSENNTLNPEVGSCPHPNNRYPLLTHAILNSKITSPNFQFKLHVSWWSCCLSLSSSGDEGDPERHGHCSVR